MTQAQLEALAIPMNKWVSLDSIFNIIGCIGDETVYTSRLTRQFYFDGDSEVMFIRLLRSTPNPKKAVKPLPKGYSEVLIDNEPYMFVIANGGVMDDEIGVWHYAYGFDSIASFIDGKK